MNNVYEKPKLEMTSFETDVITTSTVEDKDNIFENPWEVREL